MPLPDNGWTEEQVSQAAQRIELLNVVAAVVAYPAVAGFVWLCLIGQHEGLLGFSLLWLLGAGVSIRVYAQFLRSWHGVGYPPAATSVAPTPPLTERTEPSSEIPLSKEETELRPPDEQTLALPSPRSPSAFEAMLSDIEQSLTLGLTELKNPRKQTEAEREQAEWAEKLGRAWAEAEAKRATTSSGESSRRAV
jgi:hypothetical protein